MDVVFEDPSLDDLEVNIRAKTKFPLGVVKAFRKRIWQIRAVHDERDLYAIKGFNFEKLKTREGFHSIRLNDQYRLILRLQSDSGKRIAIIVAIEDYH